MQYFDSAAWPHTYWHLVADWKSTGETRPPLIKTPAFLPAAQPTGLRMIGVVVVVVLFLLVLLPLLAH